MRLSAPSDTRSLFRRSRNSVTRDKRQTHNQQLGNSGENAAAAWYEQHGYELIDRNWRNRIGELDLIVAAFPPSPRQSEVVFVEVKTRSSSRFGEAVLAVGWKKQQRIRRLAGSWLAQQQRRFDIVRFDIADVDGDLEVVVYDAAF